MSIRNLFVVLVIGLLALSLGMILQSEKAGKQEFEPRPLLNFDPTLVDRIVVESATLKAEAKKVDGQWQIPQKMGFRADVNSLSELVNNLKRAEIVEAKTNKAENYHRLGLQEIDESTSSAKLITLYWQQQRLHLWVGDKSKSGIGQYVRLQDDPQVYLIDQEMNLPNAVSDWLYKPLFDIEFKQVSGLTLTLKDTEPFTIIKSETESNSNSNIDTQPFEQEFVFADSSLNAQLEYGSILSGLVRNLLNIELKDVSIMTSELSLTPDVSIRIETDRLAPANVITVNVYQHQGKHFLHFSAGQWLFEISEFHFKQISKPLEAYLKSEKPNS